MENGFSSPRLDRRRLLALGSAAALTAVGAAATTGAKRLARFGALVRTGIPAPFTLGVASGDPTPDGIVLWTRLAPRPLEEGGGMPPHDVEVEWQIADGPGFGGVVVSGSELASADQAHSVHVEVSGLAPATWYWYRFKVGEHLSPVGRTRTAPAANAPTDRVTFAFASCQHFEHGFYTAQRHMAEEPLDLVVFLGDYIYEGQSPVRSGRVRRHAGPGEARSLAEYRIRYGQYRTDPDLQALHAAFPWVVTWDDHEVMNDYAGEMGVRNAAFARRMSAGYQAFQEHMPVRRSSFPPGAPPRLYRRFGFGDLLQLHVLDTRQYRSLEVCGPGWRPPCGQELALERTMLGAEQERWLFDGLLASPARWNAIANSVLMAPLIRPGTPPRRNADDWDDYPVSRQRLLNFLFERRPSNPVLVTGDLHFSLAAQLRRDPAATGSPVVASEFVGTSLTSEGDGADMNPFGPQLLEMNPHVAFANGRRGYVRCEVTRQRWRTDFRVVPFVSRPGAVVSTARSFTVEAGRPGLSPT